MSEHVIIIHETVRESWARDVGTFFMLVGLWAVGHLLSGEALSSAAILLGILWMAARPLKKTMTPDEARAWIDAKFPERSK